MLRKVRGGRRLVPRSTRRAEIGRLIGPVRDDLRDTTADPVRRLVGDVLERASVARQAAERRRQQDAAQARVNAGEMVPWPEAS